MKTTKTLRTLALATIATATLALPLGASADSAFRAEAKAPRHETNHREVNNWYLDRHHEVRDHHHYKVREEKYRWKHDHGRHLGHYDRDYDRQRHVSNVRVIEVPQRHEHVQVIEVPQRHEPVRLPRQEGGHISINYEIRL